MGCPCKAKPNQITEAPQQTVIPVVQQDSNIVDEQRIAQVKKEIKTIVNKYYNDEQKIKR